MGEIANVKFRIVSISDEHFEQNFTENEFENISEDNLKFQYKISTVLKLSDDIILVTPSVKYAYNGKTLVKADATFKFSVINLNNAIEIDKENQSLNVKADIFPSLVSAAYSSLRGIIYTRTANTPLSYYPLPMIEVKTLIEKNGISIEE